MKKIFFFRDLSVEHAKVNQGCFAGLPSLTGLTGLNRYFCIQLCRTLGLAPQALQPSGALLAIENYHLHEGQKKGFKPASATYEAVPAVWASFTAHIALEVEAEGAAADLLTGEDLDELAVDILNTATLCKGNFQKVKRPVNLSAARLADCVGDRERVLRLLPAASLLVRDFSYLVSKGREAGLPLMDVFVAAVLSHSRRPPVLRAFFEDMQAETARLAPVMNGVALLESSPSGRSIRPDALGRQEGSIVGSATYTLVRLQQAASLRRKWAAEEFMGVFWKEVTEPHACSGYFCRALDE